MSNVDNQADDWRKVLSFAAGVGAGTISAEDALMVIRSIARRRLALPLEQRRQLCCVACVLANGKPGASS